MKIPDVRRGEYKIIRVDGTEELVEEKPTLGKVYRAIGCECIDTVTLSHRTHSGTIVMMVDDVGMVDGKPVNISSPRKAKSREIGMALIPEDRKTEGLMLPMSVADNLSYAALDLFSRAGIIDRAAERAAIDAMMQLLSIRAAGTGISVGALSGGNQQKVVIAKWLMVEPRIILLNDPTRGIDVGTKQEMYQLLRRLADSGAAIIFYSTDYDELIGCCDRALVLYDGAIRRELAGAEITEHALIASALNISSEDVAAGAPAQ